MNLQFVPLFTLLSLQVVTGAVSTWGGLYPRESSNREVRSLDGIWNFRRAPLQEPNKGFDEEWYKKPLKNTGDFIRMAVPSSYNDITQDKSLRDHIGWVWYDREFILPKRWTDDKQRIVLRVGSAHYNSILYINGVEVTSHEGGHLPIMVDISENINYGDLNLITITMNNTLTPQTIPQGEIVHNNDLTRYPPGYFVQKLDFDFFNYAGLHRPVFIYTTPSTHIDDILITTTINGSTGYINYNVTIDSVDPASLVGASCSVKVFDQADNHIITAMGCLGNIMIENANFWWPYLMSDNPGYQYTLKITVSDSLGNLDEYSQKVGIKVMGWNSTNVTINGKLLYLVGFGKHEDANIRGKGLDYALVVKDFSIIKWLGANSFRTSHYPYAEEIMDMADAEGIMVIDECPAVGLSGFGDKLLQRHKEVMTELVRRDKNRPSVIMWSVGNEPRSNELASGPYFEDVVSMTKTLDPDRPVTCVLSYDYSTEKAGASLDVILVNRYFAWYEDTGHTELIYKQTIQDFSAWHHLHNVPVMISEYGAGSISGLHMEPSFTWSEEYQIELMYENFRAFDALRKLGFFFGEMIWNFADFATVQGTTRVGGNKKGILTRSREPKMAAHFIRERYWKLHNKTLTQSEIGQQGMKAFDKFFRKF